MTTEELQAAIDQTIAECRGLLQEHNSDEVREIRERRAVLKEIAARRPSQQSR
jgi:hypothetical protein